MNIGKVPESVLKRSVLKYVKQNITTSEKRADIGCDCALFSEPFGLEQGSATAVYIGRTKYAIIRAMKKVRNNLITAGIALTAVQISIVLSENIYESELRHMMEEAKEYANKHKITILGGHTCVSKDVSAPVITVTGFGWEPAYQQGTIAPEMDIVMTKWIGLEGSAYLAQEQEEKLATRLPLRLIHEVTTYDQHLSIVSEAAIAIKSDICTMHDVSGGGIFRALWELVEGTDVGLKIYLKKIAVKQETIEVCEFFGLNPYELLSGGALLIVTKQGDKLVEELEQAGILATVIGETTDDHDKIIINQHTDGIETRYLDKPKTDEIDRI
ncbi:MAG: AIR synthase-related protein [Lachnospiraceae bacterium]